MPDNDPRLWLEEVNGTEAMTWVSEQNARTLAQFNSPDMVLDQDLLAAIENEPDNIPTIIRRGDKVYNTWTDTNHIRGLWRRTTLESYQTNAPIWETVLDFDALAKAEDEDWIFHGPCVLPKAYDRAILRLSRGAADAVVLREFDLTNCRFVEDGFVTPEAKCHVAWYDHDTLLLCSTSGEGNNTLAGCPRTVRVWQRGTRLLDAPTIFDTAPDHQRVDVQLDDEASGKRVVYIDHVDSLHYTVWVGDISGPKTRLDIPSNLSHCLWDQGWLVLLTCTAWNVGEATYAPGTMLGIRLDAFLEGSREFEVLFISSPRRIVRGSFWVNGRLVVTVMENLAPSHIIFTPSKAGWASELLDHMPKTGTFSIKVTRLDEDVDESDGALLVTIQDPLSPPKLLLTSVTSRPPILLKRAPAVFNTHALAVTQHEAVSKDGERIPYVQIGPQGKTSDAPVHMTAYGGFNVSVQPFLYHGAIGKMWLERGGTSIIAVIRGGGEFGPGWHEAGRREGKALSHDDFAAVAEDIVTRGVTIPRRIAAAGSSNGGLLILNMLTRYPMRFGALSCSVPLADMRRYTKLLAGRLWVAEYGDPDKAEDWEFLQRISAYHGINGDDIYPPILLTGTRNDDRVHPCHTRKTAAKLLDLGHEAWFHELLTGGHSTGKNSFERAGSKALAYTFLRQSIGWSSTH